MEIGAVSKDHSFAIEKISNNDVESTKEVPEETRETLIQAAVHFFRNGTEDFTLSFSKELFDEMTKSAVVERIPHTYFAHLYNTKSDAIRSSSLDEYTIYAVNIPYPDFSTLTAYFVADGSGTASEQDDGNVRYVLAGYDAFSPFSESTFLDNLYPDDVEFFLGSY